MAPPPKKRPAPVADEEEEAFPRGGADLLTPLERKQIEEEARQQIDQELASGKKPKVKKAKTAQVRVCHARGATRSMSAHCKPCRQGCVQGSHHMGNLQGPLQHSYTACGILFLYGHTIMHAVATCCMLLLVHYMAGCRSLLACTPTITTIEQEWPFTTAS